MKTYHIAHWDAGLFPHRADKPYTGFTNFDDPSFAHGVGFVLILDEFGDPLQFDSLDAAEKLADVLNATQAQVAA